jgi:hypothetical protein
MTPTTAVRIPPRALILAALAATLVAVSLATAGEAKAAYKTKLDGTTLKVTGDGASDTLALRLQTGSPTMLELDVGADGTAEFTFDRNLFTAINVEAGGGDDVVRVDLTGGSFADESLTLNGGDGADTLRGGTGAETLLGGKGPDTVVGGDGNDRALLGDGNDRFEWRPGDDSDVIEGQGGNDLLDFAGGGASETIGISANGPRVRFTRDVAGITMDLNDLERIGFHAFFGADTITVEDLSGTDAQAVAIDLNGNVPGGDAQADTVTVRGTPGVDRIGIGSTAGDVLVSGLTAQVQVSGSDALDSVNVETFGGADAITSGVGVPGPASINVDAGPDADTARYSGTPGDDTIQVAANGTATGIGEASSALLNLTAVERTAVLGLGGGDTIVGVGNLALLTELTIDGGEGNDTLRGGNGADLLVGGNGNDFVDGNQGSDNALLGDGDDSFQWDPGDGSDTIDGQAGVDALDFFGSNIGETLIAVASGGHALLTRDIGNISMDFDNVERLTIHTLGGEDFIAVDDLSGTDVEEVELDLGVFGGGGDGLRDTVVVNGTNKRDVVSVDRSASEVVITGLPAEVRILGSEGANDDLVLQTLGGDDDATVVPTLGDLIDAVVNLGADE